MAASTPYQKLRAYTLWSVAGLAAVLGVTLGSPYGVGGQPLNMLAVAAVLLGTVTAAILSWKGVDVAVEGQVLPRPLAVVHAVFAVVAVALVWWQPWQGLERLSPGVMVGGVAVLMLLPVAIMLPIRYSVGMSVLVAALAVAVSWTVQHALGIQLVALALAVVVTALALFASFRGSVWILQLAREEATTAAMRADLAVAQERLRFSRDLHDIFGRTLTAVAVKSDLAAELADHGRAEAAAAEMRSVHELAQQALTEVRGVVAAMRTPDLATELAGARALLDSSGIAVTVVGEAADSRHAEVMGWVGREAVTNVLRHARATRCRIRVTPQALAVVSDGAAASSHGDGTVRYGAGLAGLEDRVRAAGGRLDVTRDGDTFTVRASWEEQA